MYIRLAFAVAINVDPEVFIIDEALSVGDDMFRRRCFRRIEEFKEQGKTVVFVSHSLATVTAICDRALLLDKGAMVEIGETKDVVNSYSKLLAEKEEAYARRLRGGGKKEKDERIEAPKAKIASRSEFRYGTRQAEIIEFHMRNEAGEEANVFYPGEKCIINSVACFKEDFNDPTMGITFKTLQGIEVFGVSSYLTPSKIGPVKAGSVVSAEFELDVFLNPGAYMLSVTLSEMISMKAHPLDRRMDVLAFRVVGKPRAYGITYFPTQIRIKKRDDSPSQVRE
jgi:teichoic acid transport system ATP-binding protein